MHERCRVPALDVRPANERSGVVAPPQGRHWIGAAAGLPASRPNESPIPTTFASGPREMPAYGIMGPGTGDHGGHKLYDGPTVLTWLTGASSQCPRWCRSGLRHPNSNTPRVMAPPLQHRAGPLLVSHSSKITWDLVADRRPTILNVVLLCLRHPQPSTDMMTDL